MSASGVLRDARLRAPARRKAARPDTLAARAAGALLIAATVASLVSTALLNPVFTGSDYLVKISAHQDRILAGGFFQIIAAFASAGIAVSLYPVLKRYGEALALGSVGFRLLEGALYLVAAIGTFLLLQVGQDATAGSPVPPYLRTSGALLLTLRNQAGLAAVLAFSPGRLDVLLRVLPSPADPPVAVGLGTGRNHAGGRGRAAGPVPRDRLHVGAPGCLESSHRRERDGAGDLAARPGLPLRGGRIRAGQMGQ